MTTKSKTKTTATPVTTDKPVVVTVTINPLKNGKRPLVISGAPDGEMPVVRSGNFSEIHSLFDEMWLELIKRKPKVVTKPAVKPTQPDKKTTAKTDDDKDDGVAKPYLANDSTQSEETQNQAAEIEEAGGEASPDDVAELEDSIREGQSNISDASDQLVRSIGEAESEPAEQLPLIEGDLTDARAVETE